MEAERREGGVLTLKMNCHLGLPNCIMAVRGRASTRIGLNLLFLQLLISYEGLYFFLKGLRSCGQRGSHGVGEWIGGPKSQMSKMKSKLNDAFRFNCDLVSLMWETLTDQRRSIFSFLFTTDTCHHLCHVFHYSRASIPFTVLLYLPLEWHKTPFIF